MRLVFIVATASLVLSLIAIGTVTWLVIEPKRFVSEPYDVSASARNRANVAEATAKRLAPTEVAGLSPRQAQYIVSRLCLIFSDEHSGPGPIPSADSDAGLLVYLLQLQCHLGNWSQSAAEQAGVLSP
jgi:hypothetical protein